jgi:hypothetical protein
MIQRCADAEPLFEAATEHFGNQEPDMAWHAIGEGLLAAGVVDAGLLSHKEIAQLANPELSDGAGIGAPESREVRGRAAALRLIKHMVTTGAHKDALKLLLKVLEKAGAPASVTTALEATLAFQTTAAQVKARVVDAD